MNELTILEDGIVPVYTTDTGERVVDGRELWVELQSKTDFPTWIKRRFDECDAVENRDYSSFLKSVEREIGGTTAKEYTIKLNTAKEMAMLERNAIGKQVRKYFIAVEENHAEQALNTAELSPQLQFMAEAVNVLAKQELKIKQLEEAQRETAEKANAAVSSIENIRDIFTERDYDWRTWQNDAFNKAVHNSPGKDYQAMRRDTYEELERRAGCDLTRRLSNLKRRLYESGASKSRIGAATRIDVIEEDTRIKEIYGTIIKELSMRYSIGQA